MTKYNISIDALNLGNFSDEEALTQYVALAVTKSLAKEDVLITRVDIKKPGQSAVIGDRTGSTPGRKPINRPKVEAWIRENIIAGPSTLGTVGLEGVDRQGKPLKDAPNRIYPHRLAAPEPEGVGLSLLAIDKVLRELDVEGYVSRGFAAGSPFYELVRPLDEPGKVGIRGNGQPDTDIFLAPKPQGASIQEVDFSLLNLDEDCPGSFESPITLRSKCTMCGEMAKEHL